RSCLLVHLRPPPRSTPFPYTTLFRSPLRDHHVVIVLVMREQDSIPNPFYDGSNDQPAYLGNTAAWEDEWPRFAELPDKASTGEQDRKSTRLNSSHVKISYAVFCLKKK